MPAFSAYAPGKIILLGEHAVVYGRPAIAVPVNQVRVRVMLEADPRATAGQIRIQAAEINLDSLAEELPSGHPILAAVKLVFSELNIQRMPACSIKISSTIPVAAGLGSGTAVSVAMIRALAGFLGHPLADERVCSLAFEVEKIHHGTPSGIDNTVVTYGKPVYFRRGDPLQILRVAKPFTIVIADTGVFSPTAQSVGDVRHAWQQERAVYEMLFDKISSLVEQGRQQIETGVSNDLGSGMDENHALLQELGVSSAELDRLVTAARNAGAWGAKLSGGGRGGNMIALVDPQQASKVAGALKQAGSKNTIITEIK